MSITSRHCLIGLALCLSTACAHSPTPTITDPKAQNCRSLLQQLDSAVTQQGVQDSQDQRVPGYPYLRANRFLVALKDNTHEPKHWQAWLQQLQALGLQGWKAEWANLPPQTRSKLMQHSATRDHGDMLSTLGFCSDYLAQHELSVNAISDEQSRSQLRTQIKVDDAYQTWRRVVGLYPIIALPVAYGIHDHHQDTYERYALPRTQLPQKGRLLRYQAPRQQRLQRTQVANILQRSSANPLGIPLPSRAERDQLFASFAPSWEIDIASDDDRLGAPMWSDGTNIAQLDSTRPVVYRQLSHTLVQGQALLQLNYIVWFQARPRQSRLDLLGGHLDGITWRVTLTPQGQVLLYDTMHNCGCYHMFYPGTRLSAKPNPGLYQENPLIPQHAPLLSHPQGVVLRIAHDTHYIEHLSLEATAEVASSYYTWDDYDSLRSLAFAKEQGRSLFGNDAIVAGSERAERYLFWPLGVPAPGAMRQWGHHATAFLGRRHFDDPGLIERYFHIARPPE